MMKSFALVVFGIAPLVLSDISCGISHGYDLGTNAYFYSGDGSLANFDACSAKCQTSSQCQSFAFGNKECLLYAAPLDTNFRPQSNSPYLFYDRNCVNVQSTSSFATTLPPSTAAAATTPTTTPADAPPSTAAPATASAQATEAPTAATDSSSPASSANGADNSQSTAAGESQGATTTAVGSAGTGSDAGAGAAQASGSSGSATADAEMTTGTGAAAVGSSQSVSAGRGSDSSSTSSGAAASLQTGDGASWAMSGPRPNWLLSGAAGLGAMALFLWI